MSFTAPNTVPNHNAIDQTIDNHPFFPELSLLNFRQVMRVDTVTTEDRAANALYFAMLEANQRLEAWALALQDRGYTRLEDAPIKPMQPQGANVELYKRAVYSLAKADLIEKTRDYDATNSGNKKFDELVPEIGDLRRAAAWAINDLTGKPRTTVELI